MICMAIIPVDERLAGEVRAAMARRRVSQSALAALLPISQRALSRRLCGRVSFSLHEVEAVARALGLHPSELVSSALMTTTDEVLGDG